MRSPAIPRTRWHSAAHPGTLGKVEPYLSTEQRKPRSGAGIPVLVMVVRGRVELPTFRFSGGRSYRLSYLTAVLTGFEPATSTLTGWRALLAALQDLASYAPAGGKPPAPEKTTISGLVIESS